MNYPWMKFATRDWLDNKELRRCSLAARAILADLMCLAHEGVPYGYLTDKVGPLTEKYMASRCVVPLRTFREAVKELKSHGRLSEAESGILFVERMVTDEDLRSRRAAGGNASVGHPHTPPKKQKEGYPTITIDSRERAGAGSVWDSEVPEKSSIPPEKQRILNSSEKAAMRDGLAAFLERWGALTQRSQNKTTAGVAWFAVVVPETIDAVLACLERYGASAEVERGVVSNTDKWLYQQARDEWSGTWPPARASPKSKTATIYRTEPAPDPTTPVDWKADTDAMDRSSAEFLLSRNDIPREQRESILNKWPDLRVHT